MTTIPRRPFFVAGEKASSDDHFEIIQPGEKAAFALVSKAEGSHVEAAISAAAESFAQTKALSSGERAAILRRTAELVNKDFERFASDLSWEAGKPITLARGEVTRSIGTLEASAEEASRLGGEVLNLDVIPDAKGIFAYTRREPIGPVSAITPFNFPLNLVAHKLGPAIAAGCPLVLKPSENTSLSALNLAHATLKAGWPPAALSVVPCGVENAAPLVEDERFKLISFTGSAAVGWDIKRRAGRKRVTLELGGTAPVIIDENVDYEQAARRCAMGAYSYAGQSCISVQRVYVHWKAKKTFLRHLLEETQALKMGDIGDEAVMVGPLINESAVSEVEARVNEAISQGAHLLHGGKRKGLYYSPTVLTQVSPEMKICCQEIFGPVLVVDSFDNWEDVLHKANDTEFGLQAGVYTNDLGRARQAIELLDFGGVLINEISTFRVDSQPYGGIKRSGFGSEGPRYAVEEMTHPKLVIMR